MERIYNKSNGSGYYNQAGTVIFPPAIKRLELYNSKKFPDRSTEQPTKNNILNDMSENVRQILLSSVKPVYFSCGESVYRPDEAINFMYFPETAVFSEFKMLPDGRMVEIAMTGREGLIGVSSLLNNQMSENFTQILQSGNALQIDSELLIEKLNEYAEIKELIFNYFNVFVNQISQRFICNGFHLIENRLCSWLLMLHDRAGDEKLKLTHEQIALSLGTHRPSITQITKKLRSKKIIDYSRGAISILNRAKLEAAACSCYTPIH